MKKVICLFLIVFVITGCKRIDNSEDYDLLVDNVINNSLHNTNAIAIGYKYYLPKGIRVVKNLEFNQEFAFLDDNKMYLYVDIVSYYYKNTLDNYTDDEHNFYYKEFMYDNNYGHIAINKEEDYYYVKVVYNYAKIESYVNENDISKTITYALLVLNSIEYNDNLINKYVSDNNITSNDTIYNIKKPEDSESKFSQYLQEYVQEETQTIILPEE